MYKRQLLYQFADSFYSFALALDVFMNIIAHGIDVVEEIGKGSLNHVRLADVYKRQGLIWMLMPADRRGRM